MEENQKINCTVESCVYQDGNTKDVHYNQFMLCQQMIVTHVNLMNQCVEVMNITNN